MPSLTQLLLFYIYCGFSLIIIKSVGPKCMCDLLPQQGFGSVGSSRLVEHQIRTEQDEAAFSYQAARRQNQLPNYLKEV